jgi:hypothetical protein
MLLLLCPSGHANWHQTNHKALTTSTRAGQTEEATTQPYLVQAVWGVEIQPQPCQVRAKRQHRQVRLRHANDVQQA